MQPPVLSNFLIPVLRLIQVIPVPVRDNCCSHIVSDTPEKEGIRNSSYRPATNLYCAPADSPIRSAKSAACTLAFCDASSQRIKQKGCIIQVNPVKYEIRRWITCFRQYMKAILFQKKSSERTSSLKWQISICNFLSILTRGHSQFLSIPSPPIRDHKRSVEEDRRMKKSKKQLYQWPKCRFCLGFHTIICREGWVARLAEVICPH